MPEKIFRSVNTGDLEPVTALLQQCGLPFQDIAEHLSSFLLCEEAGQILGIVGLESYGPVALLRSLVVSPGARGQGIATELCRRIEDRARVSGCRELFLLTETAEHFFRKLRYVQVSRTIVPLEIRSTCEFRVLCPDSAVCLSKRLVEG